MVDGSTTSVNASGIRYTDFIVSGTFTPPNGTLAGTLSGTASLDPNGGSTKLTFTADANNPGTYRVYGYISSVPMGSYTGTVKVYYTDPTTQTQVMQTGTYNVGAP